MALGQSSNARVHKRTISDQQKRRELALQRQRESRRDLQLRARQLASALLSSSEGTEHIDEDLTQENVEQAAFDGLQGLRVNDDKNVVEEGEEEASTTISKGLQDVDFLEARKLKGERARHWFSLQLMLPEWMVDIPLRLKQEWQAHYILGLTPLSLVWKDENCSQYFLDTDKKGIVPTCQQVVLELQEDGTVGTADEPPVILGSMPQQFLQQFMQRARQKEEVAKKEEEEEQKIISPIVGNKKCVVIMEGDPKPGALTGRMSFQNFNPSIDKLNEAIGDIHNQRASTTGTADRNGMDICRENETLQFGNDGSNKHRENEDLGQDLHRKKLRVEEDDQASYRSPKHAVTDNGNQLSADRGRKTKQEHSKLDWRHLRPPTGRTKRL